MRDVLDDAGLGEGHRSGSAEKMKEMVKGDYVYIHSSINLSIYLYSSIYFRVDNPYLGYSDAFGGINEKGREFKVRLRYCDCQGASLQLYNQWWLKVVG